MPQTVNRLHRGTSIAAGILYCLISLVFIPIPTADNLHSLLESFNFPFLIILLACFGLLVSTGVFLFIGKKSIIAGCVFLMSSLIEDFILLLSILISIEFLGVGKTILLIIGAIAFVANHWLMALDCFLARSKIIREVRALFLILPLTFGGCIMLYLAMFHKFSEDVFALVDGWEAFGFLIVGIVILVVAMFVLLFLLPVTMASFSFFFSYSKKPVVTTAPGPVMYRYCTACGTADAANSRFCANCGTPLIW